MLLLRLLLVLLFSSLVHYSSGRVTVAATNSTTDENDRASIANEKDDDKTKSVQKQNASPPSSPGIITVNTNGATRADRFPSIEDRIKLYMSNWYIPPCEDYREGHALYQVVMDDRPQPDDKMSNQRKWPSLQVQSYPDHPLVNQTTRTMLIESVIEPDTTFFLESDIVVNCANETYYEEWGEEMGDDTTGAAARVKFRINMRMYCADVKDMILPALSHVELEQRQQRRRRGEQNPANAAVVAASPPTLLQFGDNKQSHVFGDVTVPHIKKFRSSALTLEDLAAVTSDEIACYSSHRPVLRSEHGDFQFQPIVWKLATDRHYKKLYQIYREDTPWYKKKDMAIFRGQLTGSRDGYDKNLSDEENCQNLKRCRLVYNHANSTLIDARLTSTRGRLPTVLNGVPLEGEKVRVFTLLEYKGVIMIEGNDVASGLKWALLSQSVVLMPAPKHTSWAMEELLQPWIHYVPLNEHATDVEEEMQWIVDHDDEAQRISERATLWMEDLVFHPDAAEDDRLIQEELLRRYQRHFLPAEDEKR